MDELLGAIFRFYSSILILLSALMSASTPNHCRLACGRTMAATGIYKHQPH